MLADCISALYKEEDQALGKECTIECNRFLKKKIEDLTLQAKQAQTLRGVQLLNLRTLHAVHMFGLAKSAAFIEKFIDKRVAMILKMAHNSLGNAFEGVAALLNESTISGRSLTLIRGKSETGHPEIENRIGGNHRSQPNGGKQTQRFQARC